MTQTRDMRPRGRGGRLVRRFFVLCFRSGLMTLKLGRTIIAGNARGFLAWRQIRREDVNAAHWQLIGRGITASSTGLRLSDIASAQAAAAELLGAALVVVAFLRCVVEVIVHFQRGAEK